MGRGPLNQWDKPVNVKDGTTRVFREFGRGSAGLNASTAVADRASHGQSMHKPAPNRPHGEKMSPPFRVLIREVGRNALNDRVKTLARKIIQDELPPVSRRSTNRAAKAGFTLEWGASGGIKEIRRFGSRDFVVYLLAGGTNTDAVTQLVGQFYRLDEVQNGPREIKKEIANAQAGKEGERGFNGFGSFQRYSTGHGNVSIVDLSLFELRITTLGAKPPSARSEFVEDTARLLGQLILHELGHGMGADDGEGGIMTLGGVDPANSRVAPKHFEPETIEKMGRTLDTL